MDLKKRAPFVVPLAITIFVFILTCNWLALIPSGHHPEYVPPPTADVNLTYALGLIVSIWSHRRPESGCAALRILPEPPQGAVRLPGPDQRPRGADQAVHAGAAALRQHLRRRRSCSLIFTLLPAYILWLPNVGWKLFDLFIGLIQAFIFALLTILYFGTAIGEAEAH